MNKQHSIKINMIMNSILTMSSIIFPIVTFPYISRILMPEGIGRVSFVTSIVTYFSMFAQLGIPIYGIRACAKIRDDKVELSRTVQELLIINLGMCLLAYIIMIVFLITIPKFQQERKLFLVMSISIFLNVLGVEWLYKALEQYMYISIRSILFKFIAMIAMFLLVKEESDYVMYGGISIFASSASNILNFINLHKIIDFKKGEKYSIKRHLKPILIFFSMSIATTIYTNLDNVMLGFIKGNQEVGYYSASVKIKQVLVSLVTSASAVLLPRTSYFADKGAIKEFYNVIKKTMNFIIFLAVPLTVFFILFAREGIFFLSGEAYEKSIIPMKIIMPTLIFIGMTNVIGIQLLVPLGKEKQVLYSEIAGALADLILNYILISRFGATGAAIGTLIAEIVVLGWQLFAIRNISINIFEGIEVGKIVIGVVAGCICCGLSKFIVTGYFVKLLISAISFFVSYVFVLLLLGEKICNELFERFMNGIKCNLLD